MENGNSILKKFNIFQYLLGTKHQTNRIYMISLNLCDNLASNCYPDVHFSYIQLLSCIWLCNPIDYSMPGFPVHLQHLELAQTHVHRVGDAILPFHPLLSSSPPAFNSSQLQCLFQWVSSLHQVAKVLEFHLQHQSFQWTFRTDFLQDYWFDLLAVQGTLNSLLKHHILKASIL